jgi:uncharacterized spore protein YtfJ
MTDRDAPARRAAAPSALATEGPPLAGVDGLVAGTVAQLDRLLDTKQVVGEPMSFGGATVIPLVTLGFGFGAGGGGGVGDQGRGGGGGGAGGGGVKPVAVIIVDESGVRVERIPDPPSGLSKLGVALADALERRRADRASGG